ncbi:uncharacterized protein KZ484_018319 isoform 1-T1 [Pholidichthys leucotaenia]
MTPPPPPRPPPPGSRSPPPVPKPRSRFSTSSLDSLEGVAFNGTHLTTGQDAPPSLGSGGGGGSAFPSLAGVTNLIASSIPSLAGVASAIGGSAPFAPSAPPAPPTVDSIANNIASNIPGLAGDASFIADSSKPPPTSATSPAPYSTPPVASVKSSAPSTTPTHDASLDGIFSSLAKIPGMGGIFGPAPSAPPLSDDKPRPSSSKPGNTPTDVGALSQLVASALDPASGVILPPSVDATPESTDKGMASPSQTPKGQNPAATMLACWTTQSEDDSDSSKEEEDAVVGLAPLAPEGPMGRDPAAAPSNDNSSSNQIPHMTPTQPVRPPPIPPNQSKKPKQKIPRAATIKVSRKKISAGKTSAHQSAVVRASWLDVWKGFRHNVLWATLDGQLMALWKKRTDRFSEVLFHVSSITNVKKQDKGRFSIYFKKKHYDFMAHNDEVQEGWVTSLLATRGQQSPSPPELHGSITIKDTRSRAYAAVFGHDLWIYPNKEGFQLGIASFCVPLNVATVKSTGKHMLGIITPYKTFILSLDSSKDVSMWLDSLNATISRALSCSQVALRLWENPYNKVCGDCGAANPEWASVNLLLVICQNCAGEHRSLGSNLSKVRSLRMDSKVWTEPLIQLLITYGNWLANQVWAPAVPAAEQLRPDSTEDERSKFIKDKYKRGCYRRVHGLASSPTKMEQRLYQVVCSDDIAETMSLICSGAKVNSPDPQSPSLILLAERANQALQTELLRLNEYTEVPPHQPHLAIRRLDSTLPGEEEEELHGKLEDDRFLFSLENDSAACDVLDLREVLSVFVKDGPQHQFEMVTLDDQLTCNAEDREGLMTHLVHILKVILPGGVSYAEVGGASAISKVCVVEVGGVSTHLDAWLLLWEDGVSLFPIHRNSQQPLRVELSALSHHEVNPSENIITMVTVAPLGSGPGGGNVHVEVNSPTCDRESAKQVSLFHTRSLFFVQVIHMTNIN